MRIASDNIMTYLMRGIEQGEFKKMTFSTYKRDRWITIVNMPLQQCYFVMEHGFNNHEEHLNDRKSLYSWVQKALKREFRTNKTANFIKL
ncbi:MAG: hypothetical protein ACRCVX_13855 [Shewanella sp.]